FYSVTREVVPVPYVDTFWSPHVRLNCEVHVHAPAWLFVDVTIGHRDQRRIRVDLEGKAKSWRLRGCLPPGGAVSIEWADLRATGRQLSPRRIATSPRGCSGWITGGR